MPGLRRGIAYRLKVISVYRAQQRLAACTININTALGQNNLASAKLTLLKAKHNALTMRPEC